MGDMSVNTTIRGFSGAAKDAAGSARDSKIAPQTTLSVSFGKRTGFRARSRSNVLVVSISVSCGLVVMHFPAEVVAERLFEDLVRLRLSHDDVMLKALFADVLHELLQTNLYTTGGVTGGIRIGSAARVGT